MHATELLLPMTCFTDGSIRAGTSRPLASMMRTATDVENLGLAVISSYIAEKKKGCMAARRRCLQKTSPPSPRLFTPHWIVRLPGGELSGGLWLLNRPKPRSCAEHMPYYIEGGTRDRLPQKFTKPEEIPPARSRVRQRAHAPYAFRPCFQSPLRGAQGLRPQARLSALILAGTTSIGLEICPVAAQLARAGACVSRRANRRGASLQSEQLYAPQIQSELQNVPVEGGTKLEQ